MSAFISAISVSGRPAAKQDSGIIHYVHYILSLCFAAYLSIVFGFISSPFSKFLNSINFVTFHCLIPTVFKVLSGVCLCWLLSLATLNSHRNMHLRYLSIVIGTPRHSNCAHRECFQVFAFVLDVHCSEFPHDIPSLDALHMPCIVPVYIFVFASSISLGHCVAVVGLLVYAPMYVHGSVYICVWRDNTNLWTGYRVRKYYTWAWYIYTHTHTHSRTPAQEQPKSLLPCPLSVQPAFVTVSLPLPPSLPSFILSPSHSLCQAIALATLAR